MTRPLLEGLAGFVAGYRSPAPGTDPALDERIEATLVDFAGALASGLGHPLAPRYVAALGGMPGESGPARIAGHAGRAGVAAAAMANAALAHLWEVDDAHRSSTSHPGIVVVPVILALADALPEVTPAALREALVVGYEAMLRVGSFLGAEHYAVCHTTATAGAFGAAAAAGRLLDLDAGQMLWAFGHAGTQAAGLWQFLDDGAGEAKMLHAGLAARAGITAARMARQGIPGAAHILEGPRGALAAWKIAGGDSALLQPQGPLMIHDVTIKSWPTCGQMHSALDCAQALSLGDDWPGPDSIRAVRVDLPAAALTIAGTREPRTLAEAKFSTSFCIAATLNATPPDFRGLTRALLADPAVRALEARVTLAEHAPFTARFPKERPARVSITLHDGRSLSAERAFRGGDPEAPWDRPALARRLDAILALNPDGRIPAGALIDWARGYATATTPDWRPGALFDLTSETKTP